MNLTKYSGSYDVSDDNIEQVRTLYDVKILATLLRTRQLMEQQQVQKKLMDQKSLETMLEEKQENLKREYMTSLENKVESLLVDIYTDILLPSYKTRSFPTKTPHLKKQSSKRLKKQLIEEIKSLGKSYTIIHPGVYWNRYIKEVPEQQKLMKEIKERKGRLKTIPKPLLSDIRSHHVYKRYIQNLPSISDTRVQKLRTILMQELSISNDIEAIKTKVKDSLLEELTEKKLIKYFPFNKKKSVKKIVQDIIFQDLSPVVKNDVFDYYVGEKSKLSPVEKAYFIYALTYKKEIEPGNSVAEAILYNLYSNFADQYQYEVPSIESYNENYRRTRSF